MGNILKVLQLLPSIIAAIQGVEVAVPIPGQGKAKLDLILNSILAADSTASALIPIITTIVTNIVNTFNALGIFKKS